MNNLSKARKWVVMLVAGLMAASAFGQQGRRNPEGGDPNYRLPQTQINPLTGQVIPVKPLATFDIDFPGGTPAQLVLHLRHAISQSSGTGLNVIISPSMKDV